LFRVLLVQDKGLFCSSQNSFPIPPGLISLFHHGFNLFDS
jgi:hypothetical protein